MKIMMVIIKSSQVKLLCWVWRWCLLCHLLCDNSHWWS